jgi:hypothetical protein
VRVKILVSLAGGVTLSPGDVSDFPKDEALRLISAGYALPHSEPVVEVATRPPVRERRKAD